MNVADLADQLRARGIPTVVHHLADHTVPVDYELDGVPVDDVADEAELINIDRDGILVRSSGWTWILAAAGKLHVGVAGGCGRTDGPGQDAAIDAVIDVFAHADPPPAAKTTRRPR